MTPVVDLSGAAVDHAGQRVVKAVDLTITRGSWFGVIGANGSGKTSLLRALAGRLPFAAGACRLEGADMAEDRCGRARWFGFAPPTHTLPDTLRVRDALDLVGGSIDEVRVRLGPMDDALGLTPMLNRWIGDCSAGMRQRVAIAAAFAGGQRAVILDEPFNWLDPVAAFDLRGALRAMVADGLTLVTALHDLGTLASSCTAGALLTGGQVALTMDAQALAVAARDPQDFERRMIDRLRAGVVP